VIWRKEKTEQGLCGGAAQSASERAFVVHLASDCAAEAADFKGRVQHIPSAAAGNFEVFGDLAAIIQRVMVWCQRNGREP
jgi:hypothetical protein